MGCASSAPAVNEAAGDDAATRRVVAREGEDMSLLVARARAPEAQARAALPAMHTLFFCQSVPSHRRSTVAADRAATGTRAAAAVQRRHIARPRRDAVVAAADAAAEAQAVAAARGASFALARTRHAFATTALGVVRSAVPTRSPPPAARCLCSPPPLCTRPLSRFPSSPAQKGRCGAPPWSRPRSDSTGAAERRQRVAVPYVHGSHRHGGRRGDAGYGVRKDEGNRVRPKIISRWRKRQVGRDGDRL
eukprot:366551-Chlamydomonas_euryale.AAC.7